MKSLRIKLIALFLLITIPTIIMLVRAYSFIHDESFLAYKESAYLMTQIMNKKVYNHLEQEEKRSYSDYRFIKAVKVIGGEEVTISDLARYPIKSQYDGMLGYFQLEPDGTIKTPIMPTGQLAKLPLDHVTERKRLNHQIKTIVKRFNLDEVAKLKVVAARTLGLKVKKEALNKGEINPSTLPYLLGDNRYFQKRYETSSKKEAIVFDVETKADKTKSRPVKKYRKSYAPLDDEVQVEIDPFQARFDSKNLIFYRKISRNESNFRQGYVVNLPQYMKSLVYNELQFSKYENVMTIEIQNNDTTLLRFGSSNKESSQEIVSSLLNYPLNNMELKIYLNEVSTPESAVLLITLSIFMMIVLGASIIGIYKAVYSQVQAARKRQDFISSVSHELKTPLTSIQMYGEMLENGWVPSEERRQYYYQLISSESDRLSRMIQNVLNLSKLEKDSWQVNMQLGRPEIIVNEFINKYKSIWVQKGFKIVTKIDAAEVQVSIDSDAFFQIIMNVFDNSLKFSQDASKKQIDLSLETLSDCVMLTIRDYGPGVPSAELSNIYQDFYRVENEMTRTTSGTGIGLSLVRKLCDTMKFKISIENANPGLRTKIKLPVDNSLLG